MNVQKHLLWLGCGDLAIGSLPALLQHRITCVARRPKTLPAGVEQWVGSLSDPAIHAQLRTSQPDALVITLTPDNPSAEGYHQGYWLNTQYILHHLPATAKPFVLFVSSTGVYGQEDGSWVDEDSPTTPSTPSGQCLLATEQLIRQSGLPHCILRLSGIYGPGRDFVVRSLLAGQGGSSAYTNRIHRDDVCRLIPFLLERQFAGQHLPEILLASDNAPVQGTELRRWLAAQLQCPLPPPSEAGSARGGNKRCSNQKMQRLGFELRYPGYQQGYGALLELQKNVNCVTKKE
jgi:nucleoside-diphosphate-sugar epimerase